MISGWQIAEMEATDAFQQWEELNAPDPLEASLMGAARSLDGVEDTLIQVIDSISEAMAILSGSSMECKLESVLDSVESVRAEIKQMKTAWERGERE